MKNLLLLFSIFICLGTYARQDTIYFDRFDRLKLPKEKAEMYRVNCKNEKKIKNISRYYNMQNQLLFEYFEYKWSWGGHHIYRNYNPNGMVVSETESKDFHFDIRRKCYWENGQIKTDENSLEPDTVKKSFTKSGKDTTYLPSLKAPEFDKKYGKLGQDSPGKKNYTEIYVLIDKNGILKKIEAAGDCSQETMEIVSSSLNVIKKWTLGFFNGETVDSYIKLGFPVTLEKGISYKPIALGYYFPFY